MILTAQQYNQTAINTLLSSEYPLGTLSGAMSGRWNSSGNFTSDMSATSATYGKASGYIRVSHGDTLVLENIIFGPNCAHQETCYIYFFDINFNIVSSINCASIISGDYPYYSGIATGIKYDSYHNITSFCINSPAVKYMVICSNANTSDGGFLNEAGVYISHPSKNQYSSINYTNLITSSINIDGTPFNGGLGYKTGYRLNSSGGETVYEYQGVSGFIPVTENDIIRVINIGKPVGYSIYINAYDSTGTFLFSPSVLQINGNYGSGGYGLLGFKVYNQSAPTAYIRVSFDKEMAGKVIITKNEIISPLEVE